MNFSSGHFRRQLCVLRASLVFFAAWLILDAAFSEYPHINILLAGVFGMAFLFPRRLSGWAARWAPRAVWALGPPCALLAVELLNNTDPVAALSVLQCVLNLVWYYLLFALLTLLLGRIRPRGGTQYAALFCGWSCQPLCAHLSRTHHLPD